MIPVHAQLSDQYENERSALLGSHIHIDIESGNTGCEDSCGDAASDGECALLGVMFLLVVVGMCVLAMLHG